MPAEINRCDSFSVTNASRSEGKLTYIRLNIQTPCPPRGAVPVNSRRTWEVISLCSLGTEPHEVMHATVATIPSRASQQETGESRQNAIFKIGQFSFSERDLVVPVSGILLTVTRSYNSFKPGPKPMAIN